MDRLQTIEMDAIECAVIVSNESHSYQLKEKIIAIKYDGSLKMAIAIEECCNRSWIEWDESNNFVGLKAFTEWGVKNNTSSYVSEGDYLVKQKEGWYMLVEGYEFENKYERVLINEG